MLSCVAAGLLNAQAAEKRPHFEVASIKLNKGCDPRRGGGSQSPGRLNRVCRTLREYIQTAYGDFDGRHLWWARPEVLGGPRWLDTDRYDIFAKAEGGASYWQMSGPMMQALLEERFNVSVHTEDRITSVYALTVARTADGLKRSPEGSCSPVDMDHPQPAPAPNSQAKQAPRAGGSGPAAIRALLDSPQRPCGGSGSFRFDGPNAIADWYGMTMAEFAGFGLPARVGRPVVDKTGLTGMFDIHLEFSRDDIGDVEADSAIRRKPSIPKALEEQLGLKLTADKAPIKVVVVDRAERPTEN